MIFVKISSLAKAILHKCHLKVRYSFSAVAMKASPFGMPSASVFYSGFLFLIICLVCCSCGSNKVVPLETIRDHQVHDTIVLHNIQYDSVYIYKEMDKDYRRDLHKPLTINPQPSVDTILIRQHDVEYRYKLLRDTIERIKLEVRHDSIPYEVRIETIKEVPRPQTLYDRICKVTFWFLIGALLTYCFLKLKASFKH